MAGILYLRIILMFIGLTELETVKLYHFYYVDDRGAEGDIENFHARTHIRKVETLS